VTVSVKREKYIKEEDERVAKFEKEQQLDQILAQDVHGHKAVAAGPTAYLNLDLLPGLPPKSILLTPSTKRQQLATAAHTSL
jgi:hypothetical protein